MLSAIRDMKGDLENMGVKVAKFGGSSVADALQIEKIRKIIKNDEDIKYVVVSLQNAYRT